MRRMVRRKVAACLLAATVATISACNANDLVAPAPSRDYVAMFDDLWSQFDLHYSYFALKAIDWDSVGAHYRPMAAAAQTEVHPQIRRTARRRPRSTMSCGVNGRGRPRSSAACARAAARRR